MIESTLQKYKQEYITEFLNPFREELEVRADGYCRTIEKTISGTEKRNLLTSIYQKRAKRGTLRGFKRFCLINRHKSVEELEGELTG